jgi:hypothetical protein
LFGVGLLILSANACSQKVSYSDRERFTGDVRKPEQVLAYLKTAPKERRIWAEKSYGYAQAQTTRMHLGQTWGAVAKGSGESIMEYPTGKAFLLLIEGYLKNLDEAAIEYGLKNLDEVVKRPDTGQTWDSIVEHSVDSAIDWFETAIAVEAYEQSLDEAQRSKLVSYRDCLKRYRKTSEAEPDCIPLQWATGGEADLLHYMEYMKMRHPKLQEGENHDTNP